MGSKARAKITDLGLNMDADNYFKRIKCLLSSQCEINADP